MSEDTSQERTEDATPKRQKEIREKGQAARSRELNTLIIMLVGASALIMNGQSMVEQVMSMTVTAIHFDHKDIFNDRMLLTVSVKLLREMVLTLSPLMAILLVASLIGPIMLAGWSINIKTIMPKFERINPMKGLKRMFAVKGLIELVKALLKFILVGGGCGC